MIEIYLVLGLHLVGFLLAYFLQTDKLTDFCYALGFFLVAFFSHSLLTIVIGLWAIRLGGFLAFRVHLSGSDERFDLIRPSFWKYLGFWTVQSILVLIVSLPVFLAGETVSLPGLFIAQFGILYETVADWQKFTYKFVQKQKGFLTTGLWKYSQHPNYFGEILVWVGVYLAVLPSMSLPLLGLLSPVTIFVVLVFGSGIRMARERYLKKFGSAYKDYMKSTSLLIPWIK